MRVATIDIGTNTVLLLVAETRSSGELVALEERATITRLGQGVDKARALAPEAVERTNACIDDYASTIRTHGVDRLDVVGTSAMRDAAGGDAVRDHVRRTLGVDARVIAGEEEARLTFLGALAGLGETNGPETVFDIGGGSTEIVQGVRRDGGKRAEISFERSYDVGSVRMTERHVQSDPPTVAELAALAEDVDRVVETLPPLPPGAMPVGIAGTVTTLAAVHLALDPYDGARVHGAMLSRNALEAVVTRLALLPVAQRREVPGLEPKRADVIVAGGTIVLALMRRWGATEVRISDRGVRWGLALALCN
jgi:exopolyphosphatase/guanosine-5'-triphosphate,3'-diphosphate pyrophosphatase